jgi:acetolactate synthase-1/3 small subunit
VAPVDETGRISRITVVTSGTDMVIEQIKAQLDRLVPVHKVSDLTIEGPHLTRELALIKVAGRGDNRMEVLRLADAFRARVVDATTESFVLEMTGNGDKIDAFLALMRPIGLVEVSRTGAVAIARGPKGIME